MNDTTLYLLVALTASHLLAAFILQSDNDAKEKGKLLVLLRHSFTAAVAAYLLCGLWSLWHIPLVIFISHSLIDYIKVKYDSKSALFFILDQCAHFAVLGILALVVPAMCPGTEQGIWYTLWGPQFLKVLILAAGAIATVKAVGIYVGLFTAPYLAQFNQPVSGDTPAGRGFPNGGRIIGSLERALIFVFVLFLNIQAIGFLIAAKSIFRFGELKDSKNRMEAEYIIIGTLMSFLLGIITSLITKWAMGQV